MKPKFFIFIAWVFYLASQHTGDQLWFYCMIYSMVLAACAFLYRKDKQKKGSDEAPQGQKA